MNIALDGIMIFGAFAGASIAYFSGNPWVGSDFSNDGGSVGSQCSCCGEHRYHADQIVSGTAINILAIGVPAMSANILFGSTISIPILIFAFVITLP